MNKLLVSSILSIVLAVAALTQGNATAMVSQIASPTMSILQTGGGSNGHVQQVKSLLKGLKKLGPGKLPGFKGLPARPKAALPPRGLQPPKGLANAPSVRPTPPSTVLRAPKGASALPPSSAGKLPPATGLRNASGGGFQRANIPTGPRRFDGNTVGIGSRSVRKADVADVLAPATKPGAWKQKAIAGGIGVFLVMQFAPDIIISQIDFSTDEEKAAAGN